MDKQKQFEACAELDELTVVRSRDTDVVIFYRGRGETLVEVNPNYDTDNEIDRLVRELDEETVFKYKQLLQEICQRREWPPLWPEQATVDLKRETLLKVKGKWVES